MSAGVGGLLSDKLIDMELDSLLLLWNYSETPFCIVESLETTPTSDLSTIVSAGATSKGSAKAANHFGMFEIVIYCTFNSRRIRLLRLKILFIVCFIAFLSILDYEIQNLFITLAT